jgi:O-antigen/teichoic acid export membrane protein
MAQHSEQQRPTWFSSLKAWKPGRIARQSTLTIGIYGIRVAVQAGLLILVSFYLGAEGFGEFAALMALAVTMGTFCSMGFGYLVLNRTARSPTLGLKLVKRAFPVIFILATLLFPLYLILSLLFLGSNISVLALTGLAISEFILMPLLTVLAFHHQGLGYSARSMLIQTSPHILRLVAIVSLIYFHSHGSPALYIYSYFLATLLPAIALYLVHPQLIDHPTRIQFPWRLVKKGIPYALMRAATFAPNELDKTVAYKLVSAGDTGIYSFFSRAMISLALPVHAMVLAAQPSIIAMRTDDRRSPNRLILAILALSLAYGLPAALLVYFGLDALIGAVFGTVAGELNSLSLLLALATPVTCLRLSTGGLLIAFKKPLQRAVMEIAGFVLFVTIAVYLTPAHGLIGLAWSFLSMETLILLTQAVYLTKLIKSTPTDQTFSSTPPKNP